MNAGRLQRARRQVDREVHRRVEVARPREHRLEAREVELDRPSRRLRGDEQRARVGEAGVRLGPDEALVAGDLARGQVVDRLVHGRQPPVGGHGGHGGGELLQRPAVLGHAVARRVEGLHLRAPVPLAPVQGGVRLADELLAVRRGLRERGHADGDRERVRPVGDRPAGERAAEDPPPDRHGIVQVAVGEHERELVAADPEPAVPSPHVAGQDPGGRDEQRVARRVPLRVVELLQVVDVDVQERERPVVRARDGDLLRQLLLERPVVAEAREPVAQRVQAGAVERLAQPVALLVEPFHPVEDVPQAQALGPQEHRGAERDPGHRGPVRDEQQAERDGDDERGHGEHGEPADHAAPKRACGPRARVVVPVRPRGHGHPSAGVSPLRALYADNGPRRCGTKVRSAHGGRARGLV